MPKTTHFLTILLTLGFSPAPLFSGEESQSFSNYLGRPATISAHQPPEGFFEELERRDTENMLALDGEWFPFYSADIWVFFLIDWLEHDTLNPTIQYIFERLNGGDQGAFIRGDVTLGSGSKKQIFFIKVSAYDRHTPQKRSCLITKNILRHVASYGEQVMEGAIQGCH